MKKIIVPLIVVCTMILSGCKPLASPTKPPTIAVGAGQLQVYTDGNEIRDLLISGDDLWAATQGGVVKWDMQNGTYQKYTIVDGLESDDVYAITQDQQGNIWFATGKGLMRFDGKNWQNFSGNGGFDSNTIISIACDNQDDIVVSAIDASIALFDGKTWQIISPVAPPQSALISGSRRIVVDDSGNIWATVQGRLESYDGKAWDSFTPAEGWDNDTQVLAIAKAPDGSIWVATDSGLVRYNGKSFQAVTPNRNNQYLETMAFDNQGILWCITGNGISRWDGKTWQDFNDVSLTHNSNSMNSIVIDKNDDVWCGNNNGIIRFDGQSWQNYVTTDSLDDNVIRAVFIDRGGNAWFGTDYGITCYNGKTWQTFTQADGLPETMEPTSFFEDKEGNIWVGASWGQVCCYSGKTWHTFNIAGINNDDQTSQAFNGFSGQIDPLAQDKQGNIWFGTTNYAICYNGKSWQNFDLRIDLQQMNVEVTGITIDKHGNVWVSTINNGALRYDGKSWQVFRTKDGLISNEISQVFQDSQGRLWFADQNSGIELYDGRQWTSFATENIGNVGSIAEDGKGNIWCASDQGVFEYDGNKWNQKTSTEGLPSGSIYSIQADEKNNLWLFTDGGLTRYDGKNWQSFTNPNLVSDVSGSAKFAADGSLWAGTPSENGVLHFIP